MTEQDLVDALMALVTGEDPDNDLADQCDSARTFEQEMMFTTSKGFVLQIGGAEFQVTVAQRNG